ncbi:MAG: ABC transporter ATP-binding protein [Candidatus Blackburnbacteria bacterium]|nr:ABC transporter ATP-binding protein [Candidatus Blackburnbacteria bacterium]
MAELAGVSKVYRTGQTSPFWALKDINLKVKKGEFFAIVGPSGSGKTTLMNIIGLLDKPTTGIYKLDGKDVSRFSENKLAQLRNRELGFVFQNFNLLQRTTASQNVALPLVYAGIPGDEREKMAKMALLEVGLGDKADSRPNQLSGGEQQRVAIARALVTNPDIILADEPTGNLDSRTGEQIISLLGNLNKYGKTIILITHSLEIARKANKLIRLKDGKII